VSSTNRYAVIGEEGRVLNIVVADEATAKKHGWVAATPECKLSGKRDGQRFTPPPAPAPAPPREKVLLKQLADEIGVDAGQLEWTLKGGK